MPRITLALTTCLMALCILIGCEHKHDHKHGDDHHEHKAPHGGTMLELKAHAIYLELVHNKEEGVLEIYVLKDHGTKPMHIVQDAVEVTIKAGDKPVDLTLKPSDDPLAGNKPGETNVFQASSDTLKGEVSQITVKSITVSGETHKDKTAHLDHDHKH